MAVRVGAPEQEQLAAPRDAASVGGAADAPLHATRWRAGASQEAGAGDVEPGMLPGGPADASAPSAPKRRAPAVLFVGNSATYQPKELKGLPGAVQRVAAAYGAPDVRCEAVTKGGADLIELWPDFEERLLRPPGPDEAEQEVWDAMVLQVDRGGLTHEARLPTLEVLHHRFGPLIADRHPDCRVVLYQSWADPSNAPGEEPLRAQGVEAYRAALIGAGVRDVRVAWVGEAFELVREGAGLQLGPGGKSVYPALFKDDSGHPSALAGVLIAAIVAMVLGLVSPGAVQARKPRPLAEILTAILPAFWRTASAAYAGEVVPGQKVWMDGKAWKRNLPAGLIDDDEDEGPLAKYPPGLRTEKKSLGPALCDALAAAAVIVAAKEDRDSPQAPSEPGADAGAAVPQLAAAAPGPARRWRAR